MDIKLPRIEPGGILRAEHINAPNAALEKLGINLGPNSGLGMAQGANGTTLWTVGVSDIWAKITDHGSPSSGSSSSGPYAWTEQMMVAGGTWTDGFLSGTLAHYPAYESNGNTTVPDDVVVKMKFNEETQYWVFTYRNCSA